MCAFLPYADAKDFLFLGDVIHKNEQFNVLVGAHGVVRATGCWVAVRCVGVRQDQHVTVWQFEM